MVQGEERAQAAAEAMACAATAACGYGVKVIPKQAARTAQQILLLTRSSKI